MAGVTTALSRSRPVLTNVKVKKFNLAWVIGEITWMRLDVVRELACPNDPSRGRGQTKCVQTTAMTVNFAGQVCPPCMRSDNHS